MVKAFLIGIGVGIGIRMAVLYLGWLLYLHRGDRVMPWKSRERRRMMIAYERNGR